MSVIRALQDWLFPPLPPLPPPAPPPLVAGTPSVEELLLEHDREIRAIEEIVQAIRSERPLGTTHEHPQLPPNRPPSQTDSRRQA